MLKRELILWENFAGPPSRQLVNLFRKDLTVSLSLADGAPRKWGPPPKGCLRDPLRDPKGPERDAKKTFLYQGLGGLRVKAPRIVLAGQFWGLMRMAPFLGVGLCFMLLVKRNNSAEIKKMVPEERARPRRSFFPSGRWPLLKKRRLF